MGIAGESVAVVGAGIGGLSLAYQLKKQGKSVTVFEAAAEAGGKIKTLHLDGFELDLGPVSCAETATLKQLLADLHLEQEVIAAQSAVSKRYIFSGGTIHAIEPSPLKLLMHPMLSWSGRLGLLRDVFIKPEAEQTHPDETVAQFVRRHFGEEAHQKLFNPVLNGIYAGDSEALSISSTLAMVKKLAGTYGSVIKGLRAEKGKLNMSRKIIGIKGGFIRVVEALQEELGADLHLATAVKKITPSENGVKLSLHTNEGEQERFFDKVYLALPSYACADLLADIDAKVASALKQIRYPKVWQIYCEAETSDQVFDGFGFLVPAMERKSLLGAICITNLFPDKAPAGKTLFALFCGGDRPYAFEPSVEQAVKEFHSILKPSLLKVLHVQEWSEAIPQFYVGHKKLLQSLKALEARYPAIFFAGNYVSGVSLGDCVEYGLKINSEKGSVEVR